MSLGGSKGPLAILSLKPRSRVKVPIMAITQNAGKEGSVIVEYLLKSLVRSWPSETHQEFRVDQGSFYIFLMFSYLATLPLDVNPL